MSKTERNCVNFLANSLGSRENYKYHYNGIPSTNWDERLKHLDKALVVLALTELDLHPVYLSDHEYEQIKRRVFGKPFNYV